MTTREKVDKLLDRLSESELEAEYERLQQAVAGGRHVDEWGDLDAQTDAANEDALGMLDEEEAAIGFSWEKYR